MDLLLYLVLERLLQSFCASSLDKLQTEQECWKHDLVEGLAFWA